MGTKKLDVMQSAQITALEADILELRTKINLVVTDLQAISAKLNILIGDLNDINAVVMVGYTTPGSPQGHGVLEEMKDYTMDMDRHANTSHGDLYSTPSNTFGWANLPPWTLVGGYAGYIKSHPYAVTNSQQAFQGAPGQPPYAPGAGGSSSTPGGTGQGGNTAHDPDASDASVSASYRNVERIMTIKRSSANRARKLARQTLNRLRK